MSPSSLQAFAQSSQAQGVLVGFEAELAVPMDESMDDELEPDYSSDQEAISISEVVEFFGSGEFGISTSEGERLSDRLQGEFWEWLEERVRNIYDRRGETRIRKLAAQDGMSEEDIDEMMDSQSGLKYKDLQDQVEEEIRDQVSNDVMEEDWFQDEGLTHMSDVATRYDLPWPHMTQTSAANKALDQVALDVGNQLGIEVLHSTKYHAASRMPGKWVLEPDSSIESRMGYEGLELITPTPPFPLPEALGWIDRVFDWAREYGCYTNSSTGFHISVSLPSQTTSEIDWLKLVLMLGDKYVLSVFERQANTYAGSALDAFLKHMDQNANFPVATAMDAMRKGLMKLASQELGKPLTTKYVSVNMKNNFVEFRSAGGDYLENQEQIKNTMLRYVRAILIAADPEALKQEYATKLYKLLTRFDKPSPTDWVLELFSVYNAGSISKNVLINSLRSHRRGLKQTDQ